MSREELHEEMRFNLSFPAVSSWLLSCFLLLVFLVPSCIRLSSYLFYLFCSSFLLLLLSISSGTVYFQSGANEVVGTNIPEKQTGPFLEVASDEDNEDVPAEPISAAAAAAASQAATWSKPYPPPPPPPRRQLPKAPAPLRVNPFANSEPPDEDTIDLDGLDDDPDDVPF